MPVSLHELEEQALALPQDQRAALAAHLLDSLPALLQDDDLGISEAVLRDQEMDTDPSTGLSLEEFKKAFGH
ncbi:MAG: hypothetical protein JNK37_03420 [Verrucomicrobiales bacterium]|nr:hypothetical protein [Verrucomicrobiales bacterium]